MDEESRWNVLMRVARSCVFDWDWAWQRSHHHPSWFADAVNTVAWREAQRP